MNNTNMKLWSYIRHYKFNSILLRNFILIMTLISVPLVGISVFVYMHNDGNMRAEIERSAENELARTRDSVDMILSDAERLSVRMKSDPDVVLLMSERLSSPLEYNEALRIIRIQQVLQTVNMTSTYIDSIFIYSEFNDFLLTAGSGSSQNNEYYRWWPHINVQNRDIPHLWITGLAPSSEPLLSFVNRVPAYTADRNKGGVVSINMNLEDLGRRIDRSNQQQSIYIVDSQGKVMYNRDSKKLNLTVEETDPELHRLISEGMTSRIVKLNGKNQVVSLLPSQVKDWKYISIVPLQQYQSEQSRVIKLMVVLLTVSACTAIVLSFMIAVRSYSPIRQILFMIENKENPFIMLRKAPTSQWNETGYILSNLTASFHQNQSVEAQLQEKYELLRKAQAIALQAQINPHFLYNTLESINWKVMRLTNGKNEASQMLQSLSALLRLTLETEEDLVDIRKELKHVNLYVEMQKLRYKDKFSFECSVEERLLDCKIVKLVLQPLVENAIYYGVKQSSTDKTITIRVYARREHIVVRVIAASAGASYTIGRPFDGVSHSYSLTPRILDEHPKTGKPQISLRNFDAGWVHSINVDDISSAYREGRAHLLRFLTKGNGVGRHLISVAPKLGVREGRHIVGDYVVHIDDYLYDSHFDDVVARTCSHYDTHARDLGNESDFAQIWLVVLDMFKNGSIWCDIPYRSLLPQGVNGLLVASRALSVDREVSMGVRMQRDIQKIGEAAGVAAALSAADLLEPRQLSIKKLQRRLIERGVLKEEDLTRSTTTNLMFQEGILSSKQLTPTYIQSLVGEERTALAIQLAAYLGTEEEGRAIWWMRLLGQAAEMPLLDIMRGSKRIYAIKRSAALALGLLGSKAAIPFLLNMIRARENNRPQHVKALPKWVSAVIVLRLLHCREAYSEILTLLEEDHTAGINSMLLQYLFEICRELNHGERVDLRERLKQWLSCPEVGNGYMSKGENSVLSIRWNMVIWVALILAKTGDGSGIDMCKTYLNDSRTFVKLAAAKGLDEMERLLSIRELEGGVAQ
ncbi:FAD-dependent oxidoreductase [Paenibacillus sp. UNC451MF]|uniref:FAD-dependent oxidoreductase n=1 Tax=Paenibacillus sp. UNC451MF TaxID=1449063 RepID=UPI00049029AB|nr:FAD-dependent oxidoreductase [Paenibacillus sp. UNC451MF]